MPNTQSQLRTPWRIAFVAYAIAMTIGSHWPALRLGPEVPASDKTLHLLAYAGAVFMLWRTGWLTSRWLTAAIVLAWSALDEISQGIPGLDRIVTWHDFAANLLGVLVGLSWLWAMRPAGVEGGPNRLRQRRAMFVFDHMFANRQAWIAPLIGAALGGIPLAILWHRLSVDAARVAIIIAFAVAGVTAYLLWNRLWWNMYSRIVAEKPPLDGEAIDWPPPRGLFPRYRIAVGAGRSAAVLALCIIAGMFLIILLLPLAYGWMIGSGSRPVVHFAHRMVSLPPELARTSDLACLLIGLAAVYRLYAIALARHYDQSTRCSACGHDLRGTPIVNNQGRCGECGTPFTHLVHS